jgi:hypothetical protein
MQVAFGDTPDRQLIEVRMHAFRSLLPVANVANR